MSVYAPCLSHSGLKEVCHLRSVLEPVGVDIGVSVYVPYMNQSGLTEVMVGDLAASQASSCMPVHGLRCNMCKLFFSQLLGQLYHHPAQQLPWIICERFLYAPMPVETSGAISLLNTLQARSVKD